MAKRNWSHPSVQKFSPDSDPVAAMVSRARQTVLNAQDEGWSGPPFDPTQLAAILKIPVVPSQDIPDARTVPVGANRLQIEFNPERPTARVRYSIAHEIAHTFFPDCSDRIQNRLQAADISDDEWQLEMLCNIGASEILMPVGSFPELRSEALSIDRLMELRKEFGVSAEALLLRLARLTEAPCTMFAASCSDETVSNARYAIDYAVGSRAWPKKTLGRIPLPKTTVLAECTAIGFTAHGQESWPRVDFDVHVECVGIPPYPGRRLPRVVGFATPCKTLPITAPTIKYVRGDALQPRGDGVHIIAHVVNDVTPNWGGGFARVVRNRWTAVQTDFKKWWDAHQGKPSLGETRLVEADSGVYVFSMLAQHGLGGSSGRRKIRYNALARCLENLSETARDLDARVHMPRIGCGQAGGSWTVVAELIDDTLVTQGVEALVYDLPDQKPPAQRELF